MQGEGATEKRAFEVIRLPGRAWLALDALLGIAWLWLTVFRNPIGESGPHTLGPISLPRGKEVP